MKISRKYYIVLATMLALTGFIFATEHVLANTTPPGTVQVGTWEIQTHQQGSWFYWMDHKTSIYMDTNTSFMDSSVSRWISPWSTYMTTTGSLYVVNKDHAYDTLDYRSNIWRPWASDDHQIFISGNYVIGVYEITSDDGGLMFFRVVIA